MEFREFYRGVCAKIRFDYHTGTYIGELDGLPGVSYVEAGSYEDIQKSLKQAVDDHLSGRSMTSDKEWEMAAELEQARVEYERKMAEKKQMPEEEDKDPFLKRKFLR